MQFRIHVHHEADQKVLDLLHRILNSQELIMDSIDRLIQDVQDQKTVIAGMNTFISGLKFQIADALAGAKLSPETEARLAAIFPDLEANTAAIASAIATTPDGGTATVPADDSSVPKPDPAPTDTSTVTQGAVPTADAPAQIDDKNPSESTVTNPPVVAGTTASGSGVINPSTPPSTTTAPTTPTV